MGLVNKSVPLEQLKAEVTELANILLEKNPVVLRTAKNGFKRCRELTWDQNEDYLYANLISVFTVIRKVAAKKV